MTAEERPLAATWVQCEGNAKLRRVGLISALMSPTPCGDDCALLGNFVRAMLSVRCEIQCGSAHEPSEGVVPPNEDCATALRTRHRLRRKSYYAQD
eukprot:SAG11_NODE_17468_length_518_cov_0.529833_1_plen_95_part_10